MGFVKYPAWYDDEMNNYSETLKIFLNNVENKHDEFDLQYLRDLFIKDTTEFTMIVDELALRGFEFHSIRDNNLLPKRKISIDSPRIIADTNLGRYGNLNYTKLYLGNFNVRFGVKSDVFFHNMPLEGFMHLNAALSMKDVEFVFEKAGFLLLNKNNVTDNSSKEDSIESNTEKDQHDDKDSLVVDYTSINVESLGLSKRSENGLLRSGIVSVHDLQMLNHEDLYKIRNLGRKSIDEIIQVINDIDSRIFDIKEKVNGSLDESNNHVTPDIIYANDEIKVENLGLTTRALNALKRGNINTLSEFLNLREDRMLLIRNIGRLTLSELVSKQRELKSQYQLKEVISKVITIPQQILETYGEVPLSSVSDIFMGSSKKIRDLSGAEFIEIFNEDNIRHGYNVTEKILSMRTLREIIADIKVSEIDEEILVLRYQQGKTLEEVGRVLNVTRERVRQRQSTAERRIMSVLGGNEFINNLKLLSKSKYSCSKKFVLEALDYNEIYFNVLLRSDNSPVKYIPWTEHFVFEKEAKLEPMILKIFQEQDDQFNLVDVIDPIIDTFSSYDIEDIDLDHIENIIKDLGMFIYGEIVSKVSFSSEIIALLMLQKFYPKGIRLNESNYMTFKKIAAEYYNYKMPSSFRTIENIYRCSDEVFLIDKLTFVHEVNVEYEEATIEKIDLYIETFFIEAESIGIEEILKRFSIYLKGTFIDNKRLLYSILKKKLGEKYYFGHKNTLQIFRNGLNEQSSLREQLSDYLRENDGVALRKDIKKNFNWTESRLSNCTTNYKEFLNNGKGSIRLLEKISATQDELEAVMKHISEICKEGYFSVEVLYTNLIFDIRLSDFISTNWIENSTVLGQIIKRLFPNFRGATLLLFETSSPYRTIEDVIKEKFHRAYRSEILEFISSLMYKNLVGMKMINELVEGKEYLEISEDEILRADLVDVSQEVMDSVKNLIEYKMGEEDYLPLKSIHGYKRILPKIKFDWNPHLIRSIATMAGYKKIVYQRRDPRIEQLIIVRKDSPLETLEDLCIKVLKKDYNDNLHEFKVYDFLESKGILAPKNGNLKELPYEIRNGRNISVDEVGKVVMEE